MKFPVRRSLSAACLLLMASCAGGGHGVSPAGNQGSARRSVGNAQLEGPDAQDMINETHADRARQNYEDRRARRYYGSYGN
jgi:hypothetical protein